jgi:replicative DNA helicase
MKIPHSFRQEKYVLAGLMKYPQIWGEVSYFLSESDFYSETKKINSTIFSVLKMNLNDDKAVDAVIITEKIIQLGIGDSHEAIYDYILSLSLIQITEKGALEAVRQLKLITLKRDLFLTHQKNIEFLCSPQSANKSAEEIIATVDKTNNEKINSFIVTSNEPINLCEGLSDFVEDIGNRPKDNLGLITPWKNFNNYYGGLRMRDSYCFAGRAKHGKALAFGTLIPTPNGFKKIEDIKEGEFVFSEKGNIIEVVATKYWINRSCFSTIIGDTTIEADENHEWEVFEDIDGEPKVLTSREIYESGDNFYVKGDCCIKSSGDNEEIISGFLDRNSKRYSDIKEALFSPSLIFYSKRVRVKVLSLIEKNKATKNIDGFTEIIADSDEEKYFISSLIRSLGYNLKILNKDGLKILKYSKDKCFYKIKFSPTGEKSTACIQVDNPTHLYLCSEFFIPTHNSTILMDLAYRVGNCIYQTSIIGQKNIPILFLDTEQEKDENKIKLASCIANVDSSLIESGRWRNNPEITKNVRDAMKGIEKHSYHHIYVPRLSVQEMRSLCLRWYHKHVGRGNPCLIVYDYLKLSGEDLTKASKEYLMASYKIDVLKDMVKEEINGCLIFGVQRNRSGVGKDAVDDETSIALSDGIVQLASGVFIIRRKIPEELAVETDKFGTHKLIEVVARKRGFDGKDNSIIKFNGKWMNNFLCMEIDNYRVNEVGTGRELSDYLALSPQAQSSYKEAEKVIF